MLHGLGCTGQRVQCRSADHQGASHNARCATPGAAAAPNATQTAASACETVTAADEQHMRRALDLARRGAGHTHPNPAVGCVILDSRGDVVGEGYHLRAGAPHAEVFALRGAGTAARGGTAYVTLEPCSHYGRTPPCAAALVAAGVARVRTPPCRRCDAQTGALPSML